MMRIGRGCNVSRTTFKLPDMCVCMYIPGTYILCGCWVNLLMWNGDGILRKRGALDSWPLPDRVKEGLPTKEINKKGEAMDADNILYSIQNSISAAFFLSCLFPFHFKLRYMFSARGFTFAVAYLHVLYEKTHLNT